MSSNIDIKEVERDVTVVNYEVEEPTYKVANISEDDLQEILAASKAEEIEKPILRSNLKHNLLYSGVFMLDEKPGYVMVKESELAMVIEELKKAKNLQLAQQKLVTEQNRVYLKAELDKTQKALQEALEENASLIKQNEGIQRRVDELEYRNVEAKIQDMKRIDEVMQKVSLESIAESQKKRPQPKATIMLIQESNDNVERERFKSIVEADKVQKEDNDGFGDEELSTVEKRKPQKKGRVEQMNITRANVIVMYIKGFKPQDIMEKLELSKNTVYRALSLNNAEVLDLYSNYKQCFMDIVLEDIINWAPVRNTVK